VLAGAGRQVFAANTPHALRAARTCYDHIAGALGVALYDRLTSLDWLSTSNGEGSCDLTAAGTAGFEALGIDLDAARTSRRRFAFQCLDWSERRPHLAGALAAALLRRALQKKWVIQDLDSRILRVTSLGRRELSTRFGMKLTDGA
jgi:hypothetical protein